MTVGCFRLRVPEAILAAWLAAAPMAQAQTDAVGTIDGQSGIATVLRGGVPRMASVGEKVLGGDRIVTGPGARLRLRLRNGSTLAFGARTSAGMSSDTILDLKEGMVRVSVRPSENRARFEIWAPAASVSATGADWAVEATDAGTAVYVFSGRVVFSAAASGRSAILEEGFGIELADGGRPATPERWDRQRANRITQSTELP